MNPRPVAFSAQTSAADLMAAKDQLTTWGRRTVRPHSPQSRAVRERAPAVWRKLGELSTGQKATALLYLIIAVAAEKSGRGIGRIRLRRIEDVSADTLITFVRDVVVPGAMIHTDGWRGYNGLAAAGYRRHVSVISDSPDPAHEVMPRVHLVASLLKRWLVGTHQGGIQHPHLDYYLDEFTFRFNRRRSQARGLLFHRLAQTATVGREWMIPPPHIRRLEPDCLQERADAAVAAYVGDLSAGGS